jgi:putative ABC transport system permease protein
VYWINPTTVVPNTAGVHPFHASGFAVTSEFFPMLDVPFQCGSGWSGADDAARAQVVVIGSALNDKVFGGRDSVGKTIGIEGRDYRVVGVLKPWDPEPVYFDAPAFGGFMLQAPGVFMPFNTAIAAQFQGSGMTQCAQAPAQPGFTGLLHSSCAWISYVVQLDGVKAARDYKEYLEGLARQRFSWPPNVRLDDLMAWLDYLQVVPSQFKLLRLVGGGLLIVCLVDTIGLMLARCMRRAGEIGVRRALGAPRRAIYAQFLIEGGVIGVAGGILGVFLTWLAMLWLRAKFPGNWGALTRLDAGLLALTLGIAIVATLLAALYPIWRAAHVQPAWQLKTN